MRGVIMPKKKKRKNKKVDKAFTVLIFMLTAFLIFIIAALGFFYAQISSTAIYDGISIDGVDVSGMTKFEALTMLKEREDQKDTSFDITIGDTVHTVTFEDANAYADVDTAVSNAYNHGRSGDMFDRFTVILGTKFGKIDFPIPAVYDEALVERIIEEIADKSASDFQEASYKRSGDTLIIDIGHKGQAVDVAALRAGIIDNFRNETAKDLSVPVSISTPTALNFASIKSEIDRMPSNAYLNNDDLLNPFVVKEEYGVTLDLSLVEKTLEKSGIGEYGSVYQVPLTILEPEITSDEVDYRKPFADIMATVTTKLNSGNKPRTTNVKIACEYVNGTILMPGEEFSYNDVVGERTYERGFKDAKIYVSGEVVDGVGGGICQVSSTLYMAALRADLEISSRRNHRFTVDYTPLGEDATVVYGAVDFKFVNNTAYPMRIDCILDGNNVTVTLLGNQVTPNKEVKLETKVLEKTPFETVTEYDPELAPDETKVKNSGYTGYKTETYRVVYVDGVEVSRTLENKSTYTKLDKVILSGTDPEAPNTQIPDQFIPDQTPSDPSQMPEWLLPQQTTAQFYPN